MKRIFLSVLLLTFSVSQCLSQSNNINNVWYFGVGAGLDFNTIAPTVLTNGAFDQEEGTASICDDSGNLLLYTGGDSLFNSNHTLVPNGAGLKGGYSAVQSSIIVPQPGNPHIYYVFSASDIEPFVTDPGFYYSIVDITANAGQGDVTSKNNYLLDSYEKVAACISPDKSTVWIATYELNTDKIIIYELTAAGLNLAPYEFNTGTVFSNSQFFPNDVAWGPIKFTPDGKRLIISTGTLGKSIFMDFNSCSGTLSNAITIENFAPYSMAFSPDSKKLYSGNYQYDLCSGDITASAYEYTTMGSSNGQLELGPDGKIYYISDAIWFGMPQQYVSVINNPNDPGPSLNFDYNSIDLSPAQARVGLPNPVVIAENCLPQTDCTINIIEGCSGDSIQFDPGDTTGIINVEWNFDDPISGPNNTSTSYYPTHLFSSSGTYSVRLIKETSSTQDTSYIDVVINPLPTFNLGNDTSYCVGSGVFIQSPIVGDSYEWNNGTTTDGVNITSPMELILEVTLDGCTNSDTINISETPIPVIGLPDEHFLCNGDSILLDATVSGTATYAWSTGATTASVYAKTEGVYSVEVIANGCSGNDSTYVTVQDSPEVDLAENITGCQGQPLTLSTDATGDISWSTGETSSSIEVSESGDYWVLVSNICGSNSDTTVLIFEDCNIIIPNVFTPNMDEHNNEWDIIGLEGYDEIKLTIYNRWGSIVYESYGTYIPWDGTRNGENMPMATYYYVLIPEPGADVITGSVTLIR